MSSILAEIPSEIAELGDDFVVLYQGLPAFPSREVLCEHAGCLQPRTLANYDSKGEGPAGRRAIGHRICYPKASAVIWLAGQMSDPKPRRSAFKKTLQSL